MVVYYSGTGNSRWCAGLLADRLNDELIDAFQYIRNGIAADFRSGTPWVFVCPTYAWRLPRIFRDFIRSGSFEGSDEAYFVMTCGDGIGNAVKTNRELCAEKGFTHRGTLEVIMPENYVAMFPVPDREESARIVADARPVVERGADDILAGRDFPERRIKLVDKLQSGPVNPIFYRFIVKAKDFYYTDGCIGCGACTELCPTNNIELSEGRPVWGDRCTHCMACICGCPAAAIEYGKISLGKPRYKGPVYHREEPHQS